MIMNKNINQVDLLDITSIGEELSAIYWILESGGIVGLSDYADERIKECGDRLAKAIDALANYNRNKS